MSRAAWIRTALAAVVLVAALLLVRLHSAAGATLSLESAIAGHRLADAWCKECHAIDAGTAGTARAAPDFAAIANQPSTTALSLKVFLRSNHASMPNLVIAPGETNDLVNYILSLRRD
jgi:cytochrome c